MTIDKFYNETFAFKLEVIVFDYSKKKDCEKVDSLLISKGTDKSVAHEHITTSDAFCANFSSGIVIVFDKDRFKKKPIEAIKVLAHECGHVRGHVLRNISEQVNTTDSEVYLRISDWALSKCLSVKYFKKLFK